MPAAINLRGQRFGKLRVIRLTKERDQNGRRLWFCKCDCGNTATVSRMLLRAGKTKSCGCLVRSGRCGRPFTTAAARQAAPRIIRDDNGDEWYRLSEAVRYSGESQTSIKRWRNPAIGCDWLDGEAIRVERFPTAFNRLIRYHLKADLDRIHEAKAKRVKFPHFDGFMHHVAACERLGISYMTLRRELEKIGRKIVKKLGKDKDGRVSRPAYVRVADVEQIERNRNRQAPPNTMTAKEIATFLGTPHSSVWQLLNNHGLAKVAGPTGTGNQRGRKTGVRYHRHEVERLQRQLAGNGQSEAKPSAARNDATAAVEIATPEVPCLSVTEQDILDLCRVKPHKGEVIAIAVDRDFNYLRRVLAGLVKRGLLKNTEKGYESV